MEVIVKKLPTSRVEISVTLPWEEWKEELNHVAEHLAKEVKVSGFRPGKAPRAVLEKRYGKGVLVAEAAEHAVAHSYPKVLSDKEISAIGEPKVELKKLSEGETLEYSVVTAVLPAIVLESWRGPVEKINARFAKEIPTITEGEIQAELAKLAEMRAPLVTVNRPAALGDSVLVDFTVRQDGVPIENGTSEKHPLILGKGVFIPGFEEQIVGMKEGEEKVFTLSFPVEYHVKHLAGRPAEFTVKLRLVQERQIPAIDDAFAATLGSFESLEKLKENMRTGMLEEKQQKKREERRAAILDVLVEMTDIEIPEILLSEEQARMLREFEAQARSMGLDFAEYLKQAKKTEAEIKEEWAPQAKKRVVAHLLLEQLAEDENVIVESADIEAEMNKTLGHFRSVQTAEKEIDLERLYTAVSGQLKNEKVLELLEKL